MGDSARGSRFESLWLQFRYPHRVRPKHVVKQFVARLAQSVERQPFKLVAVGSSPTSGAGRGGRHVRSPNEEMEGQTIAILNI